MVAAITGSYCSFYAWERFMWNSRAKERALKKQFTIHAKNHIFKRRNDTAEESAQTMESSLAGRKENFIKCLKDPQNKVLEQIKLTDQQLSDISRIQTQSRTLKNKADWIHSTVENFANKYIGNFHWSTARAFRSQTSVNVEEQSETSTLRDLAM